MTLLELGVTYGTRETFDAMTNEQLMRQLKKLIELKRNETALFNREPLLQKSMNRCADILTGRGLTVILDRSTVANQPEEIPVTV